jgi:hypothetical protein
MSLNLAASLLHRYRGRARHRLGWRGFLGESLLSIVLIGIANRYETEQRDHELGGVPARQATKIAGRYVSIAAGGLVSIKSI